MESSCNQGVKYFKKILRGFWILDFFTKFVSNFLFFFYFLNFFCDIWCHDFFYDFFFILCFFYIFDLFSKVYDIFSSTLPLGCNNRSRCNSSPFFVTVYMHRKTYRRKYFLLVPHSSKIQENAIIIHIKHGLKSRPGLYKSGVAWSENAVAIN